MNNSPQDAIKMIIDSISPTYCFKKLITVNNEKLYIKKQILTDLKGKRINILGIGKASSHQVKEVLNIFEESFDKKRINRVVSVTKQNHTVNDKRISEFESSHPLCSEHSRRAVEFISEKFIKCFKEEILIVCLSGGTSALIEDTIEGVSIEKLGETTDKLLKDDLNIFEINRVRKCVSKVKNGGLNRYLPFNEIIVLITSDVTDNDIYTIGSSPFHYKKDQDLKNITSKYFNKNIEEIVFKNDKLKKESTLEKKIKEVIIQDGLTLLEVSKKCFKNAGYKNIHSSNTVQSGNIEEVVLKIIEELKNINGVYLSAGEISLKTKGDKIGGRNIHFVALLGKLIFEDNVLNKNEGELKKIFIASIGSDGTDGTTEYAGAWFDYESFKKSKISITNSLEAFDTYTYFFTLGNLIKTGPTGSNLMDLRVLIF